jgi:hypothetical protein
MVGLFTRQRGCENGNIIAMVAGMLAVAVLSNLPNDIAVMFTGHGLYENPGWLPVIEFPWRIMAGTLVTAGVALCFRTRAPETASQGFVS